MPKLALIARAAPVMLARLKNMALDVLTSLTSPDACLTKSFRSFCSVNKIKVKMGEL
jgi:hypothetical protein